MTAFHMGKWKNPARALECSSDITHSRRNFSSAKLSLFVGRLLSIPYSCKCKQHQQQGITNLDIIILQLCLQEIMTGKPKSLPAFKISSQAFWAMMECIVVFFHCPVIRPEKLVPIFHRTQPMISGTDCSG